MAEPWFLQARDVTYQSYEHITQRRSGVVKTLTKILLILLSATYFIVFLYFIAWLLFASVMVVSSPNASALEGLQLLLVLIIVPAALVSLVYLSWSYFWKGHYKYSITIGITPMILGTVLNYLRLQ